MSESKINAEPTGADGLSSALGAILSDPEMLGVVSSLAKELKASSAEKELKAGSVEKEQETDGGGNASSKTKPDAETDVSAFIGKLAPLLNSASHGSKKEDDRACLLRALKPYLSEGRSEAIDYIIKFSVLAKALKNLS